MTKKQRLVPRVIYIREDIWNELIKAARCMARTQPDQIAAFFMFSKRGEKGWPIWVIDSKRVDINMIDKSSTSGPIFTWNIPQAQHDLYYPGKDSGRRYCGTLLIQKDRQMTLHYAYFMGVDFSGWGGFNINLWIEHNEPAYKAYFVSQNRTNGEFVECDIETYRGLL